MNDMITLRGWVGTEPTIGLTKHNTPYCRFRMSVNDRHYDRERQSWVDSHTSWYNILCYGPMAENVADSVRKGHRVLVMGRLQIKSFERNDGTSGTGADITAASLGHDLALGMGRWNRRRDENGAGQLARAAEAVEGVGVVNPITGELHDGEPAEATFLSAPDGFDEERGFPAEHDAAAAYGDSEGGPGEADGSKGTGPDQQLMSA